MLEVSNLSKSFGEIKAVDNVSFTVPEGIIFGLIGRNGAGKTTTIRMIMNIYFPDEGSVVLNGNNRFGEDFRDRVGYLPEERGLYVKMKVLDNLLFLAEAKGIPASEIEPKAMEYLERFDLLDKKHSKIQDLSKGNRQKVQFIATILHDPDFLILDEPFSGLDPVNTDLLKEIILDLKKKGKLIILSTHLMDFAERMCDHIALIHKGKLLFNDSLSDIKDKYSNKNVSLSCKGDLSFVHKLPFVKTVQDFGNSTGIEINNDGDIQRLLKALIENNIEVHKFISEEVTLHDIFVSETGEKKENKPDQGVLS